MKSTLFLILSLTLLVTQAIGQGTIDTTNTHFSNELNRPMKYSVYLPDNYANNTKKYPVLYLLHGMFGNSRTWLTEQTLKEPVDSLMASGESAEMVIIMPDGLIDGFYINDYWDTLSWEDYFLKEFIPEVESKFRIRTDKNGRAIAGLSMGGYGAIYYGFTHPEMFSIVYGMSPAVVEFAPMLTPESQQSWEGKLATKLYGPPGKDGYSPNYAKHTIHELVKKMEAYDKSGNAKSGVALPPIVIDIGTGDFLLAFNRGLKKLMEEKNIPFEYIERPGGHVKEYWDSGLLIALPRISKAFKY